MSEKTKNILLAVLIVGLVSMTVAYAALSQTLNINGSAQVAGASNWNIHFAELSSGAITKSGYADVNQNATLVVSGTQVTTPQVTLKAPGDKVVFKFNVINEGTIDGRLTSFNNIQIGNLTSDSNDDTSTFLASLKDDINVTLAYTDGAITANATTGDVLSHTSGSNTKTLELTIEYVKRETAQELPKGTVTIPNIVASMTYTQTGSN